MHRPTDDRTFTVEDSAIVLVDHQAGTIGRTGELASQDERDQVKMWVLTLARFAKSAGAAVVLTSGQEDQQQGPLLPEFEKVLPEEYHARIQRKGVINAWDDLAFTDAVRATGKTNLVMAGGPPMCASCLPRCRRRPRASRSSPCWTSRPPRAKTAGRNSRDLLQAADIALLSVAPMITSMLGDFTNPIAAGLYEAMGAEGVFDAFAQGNLR
jgi:hypothetical protein